MAEELITIAIPWLAVANALLFGALAVLWFIRARYALSILFLWAAVSFFLIVVPMLD